MVDFRVVSCYYNKADSQATLNWRACGSCFVRGQAVESNIAGHRDCRVHIPHLTAKPERIKKLLTKMVECDKLSKLFCEPH